MRSDILKRHMKLHSKKNDSTPTIVTSYNPTFVSISDPRKRSNEKSKINLEECRKHLIKVENEYQEKLELGKMI